MADVGEEVRVKKHVLGKQPPLPRREIRGSEAQPPVVRCLRARRLAVARAPAVGARSTATPLPLPAALPSDEWHLPACKLDSDIWILEDSLDSVVLETFQGVDQGCEPADIFAIWILHSGVYRMHNPEKRCLHSLFCILYPMQMPVDRNCPAARLGSFPGFWIWILDFAG